MGNLTNVFLQINILKDGDDYNGEKLLRGSAWLLLWLQMKMSDSETVTQEFEWTHMQCLIEIHVKEIGKGKGKDKYKDKEKVKNKCLPMRLCHKI